MKIRTIYICDHFSFTFVTANIEFSFFFFFVVQTDLSNTNEKSSLLRRRRKITKSNEPASSAQRAVKTHIVILVYRSSTNDKDLIGFALSSVLYLFFLQDIKKQHRFRLISFEKRFRADNFIFVQVIRLN